MARIRSLCDWCASPPIFERRMRTPIRALREWLRSVRQINMGRLIAYPYLFGGPEGNRTPVRKPLDMTFSECSLLFEFPLARRQQTDFVRG